MSRPRQHDEARGDAVRLQKFLSDAGVASRRRCEELILEGRVLVNEAIVDTLPAFVDPRRDVVSMGGSRVRPREHAYVIVHKPRGVVCTNFDPDGRPRAIDLLPRELQHLFVVGRLDIEGSGLLLMTNDGELAAMLTHPRYGIAKVYRAEVAGEVPKDIGGRLKKGVFLSDGKAQASDVRILKRSRQQSELQITLSDGRNSAVRRMLARVGHKVYTLKRVRLGPLTLAELPPGAFRSLTRSEIEALRRETLAAERNPPPRAAGVVRTAKRARRPRSEVRAAVASAAPPRATRRAPAPVRPAATPTRRRVIE